ncbi:MAG: amidohydrolase [Candidatus Eisenbacteria sp.]|nr:amidohydrolase [Candidatus Eisenbacteria bacterium]
MRMIDSHVHLVDDESFRHTLEIERSAGAVKVIVSCLNPCDGIYKPSPEQFREDNARVYQWMRKESGFVEGWAYVNPEFPEESLDEIDRAVNEYGMVGIKLECGCVCTDARYGAIMEKAISLNLPVLQHTWFKITGCIQGESTPLDVASMARDFPQVRIIMAHMGGDWQRGIKAVRDLPNVSADISGSIVDCGMVEEGVAELGAGRILFGTDLPDIDLWTSLGKVMGSEISCRDREMILYENAARLMGANAE